MKVDEIRAKMEKLNQFILDSEITVLGGKMVDLGGLDRDIALICNKAVALPPPDARDMQPLMAAMIGNLERLSIALKDYKDEIGKK
ncbi:MAG: hypothetical protein DI551_01505 [Micavibrio aeruginosavorus]|uniref:Uncharacterized protein n=1 Tax=Micavibrio aeruginosavorus TaxID=349221 RepID=A0A2W5NCI9_9BACT|nr:MAG: hypothetical protein DI551_01505 [Micavibrio aeruginosavorus]